MAPPKGKPSTGGRKPAARRRTSDSDDTSSDDHTPKRTRSSGPTIEVESPAGPALESRRPVEVPDSQSQSHKLQRSQQQKRENGGGKKGPGKERRTADVIDLRSSMGSPDESDEQSPGRPRPPLGRVASGSVIDLLSDATSSSESESDDTDGEYAAKPKKRKANDGHSGADGRKGVRAKSSGGDSRRGDDRDKRKEAKRAPEVAGGKSGSAGGKEQDPKRPQIAGNGKRESAVAEKGKEKDAKRAPAVESGKSERAGVDLVKEKEAKRTTTESGKNGRAGADGGKKGALKRAPEAEKGKGTPASADSGVKRPKRALDRDSGSSHSDDDGSEISEPPRKRAKDDIPAPKAKTARDGSDAEGPGTDDDVDVEGNDGDGPGNAPMDVDREGDILDDVDVPENDYRTSKFTPFRFSSYAKEDHKKPLYGVRFSPHHRTLGGKGHVFASVGGERCTVYECPEDGSLRVLQCYADEDSGEDYYACAWSYAPRPGGGSMPVLAIAGLRGIIRIIHTEMRSIAQSLVGHGHAINDLRFHPQLPHVLLSASQDVSLRLWNVRTGVPIAVFAGDGGHRDQILHADFNLDATRIVSCGMDIAIKVWAIDTPQITSAIERSDEYDPASSRSYSSMILVQDPVFSTLSVHDNYVDCVSWLGNLVLSKSVGNTIALWKPDDGPRKTVAKQKAAYTGDPVMILHNFEVKDCEIWYMRFCVDPMQRTLAVGNIRGSVYVYPLDVQRLAAAPHQTLSHPKCRTAVRQVAISADGT